MVTHWNPSRIEQVFQMALLGATNVQIAGMMMVSVKTIEYWTRTKPEFAKAMHEGKMIADAKVAEALYKAATGYDYVEEVVTVYKGEATVTPVTKHQIANPWAMWKWLTARQRGIWADVEPGAKNQTNILNINNVDFSKLSTDELLLLKKLQQKFRKELPESEEDVNNDDQN